MVGTQSLRLPGQQAGSPKLGLQRRFSSTALYLALRAHLRRCPSQGRAELQVMVCSGCAPQRDSHLLVVPKFPIYGAHLPLKH